MTANAKTPLADAVPERITSRIAYLTRTLKMPTIGWAWDDIAVQVRDLSWSHEQYLAAVLERQAADREAAGSMMRARTAHFPAVKTLRTSTTTTCPHYAGTCARTWPPAPGSPRRRT